MTQRPSSPGSATSSVSSESLAAPSGARPTHQPSRSYVPHRSARRPRSSTRSRTTAESAHSSTAGRRRTLARSRVYPRAGPDHQCSQSSTRQARMHCTSPNLTRVARSAARARSAPSPERARPGKLVEERVGGPASGAARRARRLRLARRKAGHMRPRTWRPPRT